MAVPGNLVTRILSLPFTLLSLILTRILRFRGVPYLRLAWPGSSPSSYLDDDPDTGRGVIVDPVAASRAFVRGLAIHARSDTGAGHYQHMGDAYGASSSSSASSSAAASGSGSSSGSDRAKDALWFTEGGYNAALRRAKEDNLVLCVVLTCREHDDHATFLRDTLCTDGFRSLMQEHRDSILLWGGDVTASRDAHVASVILQTATFPFISFISVQPLPVSRITGNSNSMPASNNKMAVFSRLEGIPATTVAQLGSHISEIVLARLGGFLNRLKAQKREREAQRHLREEQDRAYAEAGRRDRERVKAKEAELRAAREAEESKRRAEQAKLREGQNRDAWRRATAAAFGEEPPAGSQSVRFVVRLPDGKRLMRRFDGKDSIRRVWEYVECEAHGVSVAGGAGFSTARPDPGYEPTLGFALASTFPRRVMQLDAVGSKTVDQLVQEGIVDKTGANLVTEGLILRRTNTGQSGEEVEDESSEEEAE